MILMLLFCDLLVFLHLRVAVLLLLAGLMTLSLFSYAW
jgi:hypothetical protein